MMPTMFRTCLMVFLLCICLASQRSSAGEPVVCPGHYRGHLQGICTDSQGNIYWSFTEDLVKTTSQGELLRAIPVANHHGDLCYVDGRIYVAVNLGKFNRPAGEADSWIYVYDADSLDELARHEIQQVVHEAGGIAHHAGRFLVVGGLPPGTAENYLYEFDADLNFVTRHTFASGYTLMGIQTAAYADQQWWFGCYGKPRVLLRANSELQFIGQQEFDASLGIAPLDHGRFLIGRDRVERGKGHVGSAIVATLDADGSMQTE